MSATQDEVLIETALRMTLLGRRSSPSLLFHSDRGSQYTSDTYRAALAEADITMSMSRTGNCYDNAVTESFFGTLKGKSVERSRFQTRAEPDKPSLSMWSVSTIGFRWHSSLGYVSPVAYEQVRC